MEFKELSSGVKISVLGIGTWKMGGGMTADKTRDKENVVAIKTAIRLGMTHTTLRSFMEMGMLKSWWEKQFKSLIGRSFSSQLK